MHESRAKSLSSRCVIRASLQIHQKPANSFIKMITENPAKELLYKLSKGHCLIKCFYVNPICFTNLNFRLLCSTGDPTSLVRLLLLGELIFGVTVKESKKCHLGLTEAESNVWLRQCNSSEC